MIQRQQQELARAQQAQEAAYQPIDRAPMEQAYQKRAQSGGTQLLAALAAQQAGAGFEPFQAHYLKQAAAARAPMQMDGGTMTEQGFIEDPNYTRNLNIKRADAKAANLERALQGNITAEEGERLKKELQATQQEFVASQNALQRDNMRVLKSMSAGGAGDDGLSKATIEGYTPEGKRVVTDKQGIPYVVDIVNGRPTQTVYNGQIIPKATQEKNVATATEHLASAEGASALLEAAGGCRRQELRLAWQGRVDES